jgi:Asp-tRNA(Asn)/Glu-tRNA(Gln) amidotransferase A subunit family amidase
MSDDLTYKTAIELKQLISSKQLSPVELLDHTLARLEQTEPKLNAFVTVTEDAARDGARDAERAVMAGDDLGLLHGLPISIKDLIAVGGVPLTFGSRASADNVADADAPAVTRNPWNLDKTPGGSSCGAVASVAAGVTPFALGTDGGGSIRIPSCFTGLFGIKAQFGRVPVYPPSATPTLAHVGPIARTVRDAALLLEAIAGFDRRDPFSVAAPVPDFTAACDRPVTDMRIAWSPTLGYAQPIPEVVEICEAAVKQLEQAGCRVELVERVMDENPSDMWMAEFYAGVGTRLKPMLDDQPDKLDPAVVEVLANALDQSLETYYGQVFARYDFREKMRSFMTDYDLLVSPTLPVPAFDVGLNRPPQMPDANIISWVAYTYPFNLTGQPGASIPAGFTADGLPVGLQLIAKTHCESDIFRAATALEAIRPWAHDTPELS